MNDCTTETYRWSSAHRSDIGKVRKLNEDSVLDRPEIGLWVVADGMGGHAGGDRASRLVVDALAALSAPSQLDTFVAAAVAELEAVNAQLYDEALRGRGHIISGTTVAALLVHGRRGSAVWAGDSRIYLYRNNTLHALSRDHSQVEEWITNGLLERDHAENHPAANIITRAVGAANGRNPISIVVPPSSSEPTMMSILADGDCERCAGQLLSAALDGDARDNISLVVIRADALQGDATKTVINPAFQPRGGTGEA